MYRASRTANRRALRALTPGLRIWLLALLLALPGLLLVAMPVWAVGGSKSAGAFQHEVQLAPSLDHGQPLLPVRTIQLLAQLTLSEAIDMAKRRYPGRVLSAKRTIGRNGKVVYKVKILSRDGEIRTLRIAADQGGA